MLKIIGNQEGNMNRLNKAQPTEFHCLTSVSVCECVCMCACMHMSVVLFNFSPLPPLPSNTWTEQICERIINQYFYWKRSIKTLQLHWYFERFIYFKKKPHDNLNSRNQNRINQNVKMNMYVSGWFII